MWVCLACIYACMCVWKEVSGASAHMYMDFLKMIIFILAAVAVPWLVKLRGSWCMSAFIIRIDCLHTAGVHYVKVHMAIIRLQNHSKLKWVSLHIATKHIFNMCKDKSLLRLFVNIVMIWGTGGVLHFVRLLFHMLKAFIACLKWLWPFVIYCTWRY